MRQLLKNVFDGGQLRQLLMAVFVVVGLSGCIGGGAAPAGSNDAVDDNPTSVDTPDDTNDSTDNSDSGTDDSEDPVNSNDDDLVTPGVTIISGRA